MFAGEAGRDERRPWGKIASFVLHGIALVILLHRPEAIFVSPQSVKLGEGTISTHVVYVPPDFEASDNAEALQQNKLTFRAAMRKRHAEQTSVKPKEAPDANPQGEIADSNAHAGTAYGSIWELMEQGHDVKPAFPVVYPAPDFSQANLPAGYQGDVVVEVTIERDGSVSDMKVIRSVGYGVDEKVMAAVRNWRFRPAILDGTPIASKHDVHFHLPS